MKTVIYRNWNGNLMTTTEENYKARIQDARKIHNMKEFSSPESIIEYYCKYFGSKPEDFVIID